MIIPSFQFAFQYFMDLIRWFLNIYFDDFSSSSLLFVWKFRTELVIHYWSIQQSFSCITWMNLNLIVIEMSYFVKQFSSNEITSDKCPFHSMLLLKLLFIWFNCKVDYIPQEMAVTSGQNAPVSNWSKR